MQGCFWVAGSPCRRRRDHKRARLQWRAEAVPAGPATLVQAGCAALQGLALAESASSLPGMLPGVLAFGPPEVSCSRKALAAALRSSAGAACVAAAPLAKESLRSAGRRPWGDAVLAPWASAAAACSSAAPSVMTCSSDDGVCVAAGSAGQASCVRADGPSTEHLCGARWRTTLATLASCCARAAAASASSACISAAMAAASAGDGGSQALLRFPSERRSPPPRRRCLTSCNSSCAASRCPAAAASSYAVCRSPSVRATGSAPAATSLSMAATCPAAAA